MKHPMIRKLRIWSGDRTKGLSTRSLGTFIKQIQKLKLLYSFQLALFIIGKQVWLAWPRKKVDYKDKFLQRTSVSKKALENFWSFIERNEKKILNYYEALIDEDEFVKMIFYD
ncbi:hypothetical protein Gotur_033576, partial [Gossypium turneri]